jgi:hypothetical protein
MNDVVEVALGCKGEVVRNREIEMLLAEKLIGGPPVDLLVQAVALKPCLDLVS